MRQLKNWDNKTWLSSKKYILSFNNFLKNNIRIKKSSTILDIGCGRANIISLLQNKYNLNQKPIGIDIIKNNNIKKNIIFKKIDAIKYLKNTKKNFDLILIKQTIHFFSKKKIKMLIKLAKLRLNKNGKIFILSLEPKNNEIPCFKLMKFILKKSLKKDYHLMNFIKRELKKFIKKNYNFKVIISKKNYIRMLKNRYISCLLNMSKKKIIQGINEFSSKHKNRIVFNDKLICLIYKN
jgi:ubiquinone/menaquinone biosynthesis C-methylase UbiE